MLYLVLKFAIAEECAKIIAIENMCMRELKEEQLVIK